MLHPLHLTITSYLRLSNVPEAANNLVHRLYGFKKRVEADAVKHKLGCLHAADLSALEILRVGASGLIDFVIWMKSHIVR